MNESILMNANFIPDKLIVLLIYEAKPVIRIIDGKSIETPEMLFRNIRLLPVFKQHFCGRAPLTSVLLSIR